MAVYTMGNAKLYVGTTATADDITSYKADAYQEVGEVQSVSALVDLQNFTNFTALNDSRVRNVKTTKAAENITVTCGFDPDDAGQTAMRSAGADQSNADYNFKIVYDDQGSGTNPTSVYWSGPVGNDPYPGGAAEDIETVEFQVVNNTGFTVELRA